MKRKFGIDISLWQTPAKIDYDKLARQIDFVILRAGFTGHATGASYHVDHAFHTHYTQFHTRNVPIGVYWYSCANTPEEGVAEAKALLAVLKDKELRYPVFIDSEDGYHQQPSTKDALTNAVRAFCKTIEAAGYYVGIYASSSWFSTELFVEQLAPYDLWVAQWGKTRPKLRHGIWQYSSKGRLDGYDGPLDFNYAYKDYAGIITANGLNQLDRQPGSRPGTTGLKTYTVQKGDTLWAIAKRFLGEGNLYPELITVNRLTSDRIQPGQVLQIPRRHYRVRRGDTLWQIAVRFLGDGARFKEIEDLNRLPSHTIREGQELWLPER